MMQSQIRILLGGIAVLLLCPCTAPAQGSLLPQAEERALIRELSGIKAKDYITQITAFDRTTTDGYRAAMQQLATRLKEFGLASVSIEKYDGSAAQMNFVPKQVAWWPPYGWTVRKAQLWLEPDERLADFEEQPITLARYSRGAHLTAEAVYVGTGIKDEDYIGLDVKGKIVVAHGYAPSIYSQAVVKHGAVGIVTAGASSYSTLKGLEYPTMVVWQVMDPDPRVPNLPSYAFSLSEKTGNHLIDLIKAGKKPRLRVDIDAEVYRTTQDVLTAVIPGSEPSEEILFTAHLDHPKPSANDNASGSGLLLEIARSLSTLAREGLFRPRRSIRFLWVTEGSGTFGYIQSHPDIAQRVIVDFNLDMVGENQCATHSVMRISRTPDSLPSFLNDVVEEMAQRADALDLNSPLGTRGFLNYRIMPPSSSSDHYDLNDGGIGVPAVMISHGPDDFHHSNMDTVDKLDPSELNRVGFIVAGAAMAISEASTEQVPVLAASVFSHAQERIAEVIRQGSALMARDISPPTYQLCREKLHYVVAREIGTLESLRRLGSNPSVDRYRAGLAAQIAALEEINAKVLSELYITRTGSPPAANQPSPAEQAMQAIIPHSKLVYMHNMWDELIGERALSIDDQQCLKSYQERLDLAYLRIPEFLNFVDGRRNLWEITQAVAVEAFDWDASFTPIGAVDELNTNYRPPDPADILRLFTILRKAGLVDW